MSNPPIEINSLGWTLAAAGSFGFGLSKTGIPGVGILGVALFAHVFPNSPGIVLPLLIAADFVAGYVYFRHAVWSKLLRMFPWAAAGIGIGSYGMLRLAADPNGAKLLNVVIGWILIALVALSVWWRWFRKKPVDPEQPGEHGLVFEACAGVLAGFTTMVANAAGPIMILYLLRMKLPKLQFVGTCSCFFLVLNCFKVPLMAYLGYITPETIRIDGPFFLFSLLGALAGWVMIKWINQAVFETLCLALTLPAAIWLVK
ncbi:MAG TPA: sulfite exporter TauE/SafE family protein [Planctomycetota bacterium]|nr:sulfite exporter TauE/SafE family protein [Planctomycetota bacterium]